MPGPVPKRSSQRRRRNTVEGLTVVPVEAAGVVPIPESDESWHPRAREWFESLGASGQVRFFEPSDWAMAKITADLLSDELQRESGARATMIAELGSFMDNLLTTEGARRRVRIELERAGDAVADNATVSIMDRYRDKLAGD